MSYWTTEKIVKATNASTVSAVIDQFSKIQTDSRKVESGDLFLALKGEAFDGHEFVTQAVEKGAKGILVHQWEPNWDHLKTKAIFFKVADTLTALQDLGHFYRLDLKTWLVGITGSNGKTSTKEFSAALIKPYKNVHWSQGSFNNHWGVPFTLLELKPDHQIGLIEMGMNHAGEIKRLVEIAEPDCVVCTMVGRAHIEYFGSVEAIGRAKAEIYENAKSTAAAVFNIDNSETKKMYQSYGKKFKNTLTFSQVDQKADIFLEVRGQTLDHLTIGGHIKGEKGEQKLALFGVQNIVNLSAAVGIALSAGISPAEIWKALPECKSYWGRNQKIQLSNGAAVLFDAYNANPDSMQALLGNVKSLSGFKRKIGFFAEMLELGDFSAKEHEALALAAAQAGYDEIYFYGPDQKAFSEGLKAGGFKGISSVNAEFDPSWVEPLKSRFAKGDLLTFKASRGMKMERIIQVLDPSLNFQKK